jgi:hypothetical protein
MAKHAGSLFAVLRALADAMKTKSVSAGDSLSATLEVRFTSGALAPEHRVPFVYTQGHVVDPLGLALESLVDSF